MLILSNRFTTPATLIVAACSAFVFGCGDSDSPQTTPPPAPSEKTTYEGGNDYAPFDYKPSFAPDYNNLRAQPWVKAVTTPQQDNVDVFPDRLEFPESMTEVGSWQPGRLVVSGPSKGAGKNPVGFARRVVKVDKVDSKYVVTTTAAAIEDILQGDFQLQLDPEKMIPVNMEKADLQWVADNLYGPEYTTTLGPGDPLVYDYPPGQKAFGILDDIGGFFGDAAEAVGDAALDVWKAITPESFGGSIDLKPTIELPHSGFSLLRPLKVTKDYKTKGGTNYQLFFAINTASVTTSATFKPGIQVGAQIGVPGHNARTHFWLNIDGSLDMHLKFALAAEAGIQSMGGRPGTEIGKDLAKGGELAKEVMDLAKAQLAGDPDLVAKPPAGGWRRTLAVSKPKIQVFAVGPIPVVLVETIRLDVECGFQAKASVNASVNIDRFITFKYNVDSDSSYPSFPTIGGNGKFVVDATGGGEASVSCGLIPRVNLMLYDTVGLFAGVRGSLVAKATYESKCKADPKDYRPDGVLDLSVYPSIGIIGGARLQAPGSSLVGKSGVALGTETSMEFYTWNLPAIAHHHEVFENAGLGYCTPTCQNLAKDGDETDADCGGPCDRCRVGKACLRNSDCSSSVCLNGTCSTNQCGDGIQDGQETDIDCGGANCYLCAVGMGCRTASDCVSTFCTMQADKPRRCVDDHCVDGVKDGDEGGVDCGGANCPKCATGAAASRVEDCASGFFNGSICVATACVDRLFSSGETDVDCGGDTCAQRCGFQQSCKQTSDCSSGLPCHPTLNRCVRTIGEPCTGGSDCLSTNCEAGVCAAADSACTNETQDGAETDVDCGGPSCNKCGVKKRCMVNADCLFGSCITHVGQSGGSCAAPAGLLAAWPFNGSGEDVSGKGRGAALLGGASYTPQAHSGGQAASFGDTFAWAAVGRINLGDTFTISAWLLLPDLLQSAPIVGNTARPQSGGNGFQFYASGQTLAFGSSSGTEDFCNFQSVDNVLLANTWQHVAVTFDRSGKGAVLYYNGVAVQDSNPNCANGLNFSSDKDLFLGGFGSMPGGTVSLDDVRIYDSVLSAAEIAAIAKD